MMKTVKKCCLAFIMLCIAGVMSAQERLVHVVQKGETVKTISELYKVSEESLVEENPTLKNYIYPGMKVRIPSGGKAPVTEAVAVAVAVAAQSKADSPEPESVKQESVPQPQHEENLPQIADKEEPQIPSDESEESQSIHGWNFSTKFGYFMNPNLKKIEGVSTSDSAFQFCMGADYVVSRYFYAEALLGYIRSSTYVTPKGDKSTETSSHALSLSQHANVILPLGKWVALGAFAGPEETFFLTGSVKKGSDEVKFSPNNRFSPAFDVGAKVYIGPLILGIEYKASFSGGAYWGFFLELKA